MLKEELLKHGLTEEQADNVLTLHTTALEGYVPKAKLAESEMERVQLTDTVKQRDEQLKGLQKITGDSAGLQEKLDAAITENKTLAAKSAADLAAFKLESAVVLTLAKDGARNPKAVMDLLNMSEIRMEGDAVSGLAAQVEVLKKSDAYLFAPNLEGREPYGGSKSNPDEYKDNPFKKETFNLTKQGQLLRDNPELYHKLKAAAGQ
ncbi:MAG: phage scaffolding protein [Defluviitaleaceae bacterium]|nr:phage scaffolding protein [Defluviitaleaceae bacterium]MCL2273432.1 phage scaffolding protein [Defluviitaleaceae bacterium]